MSIQAAVSLYLDLKLTGVKVPQLDFFIEQALSDLNNIFTTDELYQILFLHGRVYVHRNITKALMTRIEQMNFQEINSTTLLGMTI